MGVTATTSRLQLCLIPFTHLWLYKQIDGTYNDFLKEENVDLLLCSTWFRKQVLVMCMPSAVLWSFAS